METPDFPPNSQASKEASKEVTEEKKIGRVTSGEVIRKKKSLRKKFTEVFIGGDAKTAITYAAMDVFLPAAQDTIIEVGSQFWEKLWRGDIRRHRVVNAPPSGPYGRVDYGRFSQSPSRWSPSQRAMSRQARARHDFDEILLTSRAEAEAVIDGLYEVISRYEVASVADLYELLGVASDHTDNKWGWTSIRGAGVTRSRDGYLLDLPDPIPLN